jgi:hypothetical protein
MRSSSGLFVAALLLVGVPVWAQTPPPSLGELAKKTQEAKKRSKTPAKTFTNEDVKKISLPPETSTAGETKSADGKESKPTGAAKSGDAATADDAKAGAAAKPDAATEEKYWHARMDGAREELRRNQAFRDALQSRINGLTADFSARDDPYQRAQIADDRRKALAELDRVTKAIEDNNKAIAAIEEEARKAMVPPGWIR